MYQKQSFYLNSKVCMTKIFWEHWSRGWPSLGGESQKVAADGTHTDGSVMGSPGNWLARTPSLCFSLFLPIGTLSVSEILFLLPLAMLSNEVLSLPCLLFWLPFRNELTSRLPVWQPPCLDFSYFSSSGLIAIFWSKGHFFYFESFLIGVRVISGLNLFLN